MEEEIWIIRETSLTNLKILFVYLTYLSVSSHLALMLMLIVLYCRTMSNTMIDLALRLNMLSSFNVSVLTQVSMSGMCR